MSKPERSSDEERGESFRILFVCSGNTCRSPLAEAIARDLLRERGWSHVSAVSAGAFTSPGLPASEGALRVAERHGLDVSRHRSRPLDLRLIQEADLVLVMAPSHLMAVIEMGGGGRASLLPAFASGQAGEPGADRVPDPIGGGDEEYEETFRTLGRLVDGALRRLEPVLAP